MAQALERLSKDLPSKDEWSALQSRLATLEKTPSPSGSSKAAHGLCAEAACDTCKPARAQLMQDGWKTGRLAMVQELNEAAEELGITEVLEQIEQYITERRSGKKPQVNDEIIPGVV